MTGIVALVLSTNPNLNGQQVADILTETASPLPDRRPGAGRLDAAAALSKAKAVNATALPKMIGDT
jgi:hypothetical protein